MGDAICESAEADSSISTPKLKSYAKLLVNTAKLSEDRGSMEENEQKETESDINANQEDLPPPPPESEVEGKSQENLPDNTVDDGENEEKVDNEIEEIENEEKVEVNDEKEPGEGTSTEENDDDKKLEGGNEDNVEPETNNEPDTKEEKDGEKPEETYPITDEKVDSDKEDEGEEKKINGELKNELEDKEEKTEADEVEAIENEPERNGKKLLRKGGSRKIVRAQPSAEEKTKEKSSDLEIRNDTCPECKKGELVERRKRSCLIPAVICCPCGTIGYIMSREKFCNACEKVF